MIWLPFTGAIIFTSRDSAIVLRARRLFCARFIVDVLAVASEEGAWCLIVGLP